ncbi:MAG: discoidin domain-containing protein, partial [bacterium]|nr:discoidin domain-containing protein [bacterium]
PPKTIDSVRFTIDEAAGSEVGISEFEVYPARVKNIAPDASVAVSSESSSTSQTGLKAIDGKTGGYPGNYREEWASQNEVSGAWISLSWNVNRTINSVVLYDRPNPLDNINGALLEFSDGSTIEVGSLPEDGSAHTVTFDAKTVSWVKLNISDAEGVNVGLAEMQVFGYPLEEGYGNIAPFSRVLVSSQGSAQAGIKAIDEEKDGYPGDYSREWSTRSETAGAWITLEWERTFSVDSVILYDRPNSSDNITSGSLLFSDGSSVSVGTLPNNGSGHIINFPAREIKWVKLVIDEAAGHNTGLSEIEVFGVSVD